MEPRGSRTRSAESPDLIARPISEQHLTEPVRDDHRDYRSLPKQRNRIGTRLLISVGALILMAGVSAGLIFFAKEKPAKPNGPNAPAKTRLILPDEAVPKSPDIKLPKTPPAPTGASAAPIAPANPESITPKQPPHSGDAAMKVVEKFLAASGLDERLPLLTTNTPPAALADSVLAKPFPSNPRVAPDFQENNPSDGSTDFYYNVDFTDTSRKADPQLLLVRSTANTSPKIIVDPFLDSFGGRLAAFAGTPSDKTATFQVIISAVAQVTADRNIPNHENKLRLKLMPRDNEKEIASAYFTKRSKLAEMLVTEGSGFRYGQARTAKVALRWNKEEDPANPFLEVTDIKEFRWNP